MVDWTKVESEMRSYIKDNNLNSPQLIMNNLAKLYCHLISKPELGLNGLTFDKFVHYAHEGLARAMFMSHFN